MRSAYRAACATRQPIRDAEVRLWIYQPFADTGRPPTPVEVAARFELSPDQVAECLSRLQRDADALVLIPGSPYIWMPSRSLRYQRRSSSLGRARVVG
jgi:hypothetical protein